MMTLLIVTLCARSTKRASNEVQRLAEEVVLAPEEVRAHCGIGLDEMRGDGSNRDYFLVLRCRCMHIYARNVHNKLPLAVTFGILADPKQEFEFIRHLRVSTTIKESEGEIERETEEEGEE
ncbi:hypothetical protein ALC53_02014 [Atta colombica]|uniref:Uncharacterized protein n=1 Tax=Atta colombica TaxID=520822 RepID=A0A195BRN6_9HYME|nr:hypothetical protein ALC53_02014 [Atta colombica]